MKKILKRTFLVLLIAFVGIQFIPTTRNISDVVLDSDFIKAHNAPENLATLLQTSCYDCHSDNTNYPWYNAFEVPIRVIISFMSTLSASKCSLW